MPITPVVPTPIIRLSLRSTWAHVPIDLDLSVNDAVWSDAGTFKTGKAWVLAKNDAKFLYVVLDVIADTDGSDVAHDYFWLSFDTDENRAITANKDVNYGPYPGTLDKLGLQKYLGPGIWTSISVPPESEVRAEFGPSPKSALPHRIYKFKIQLSEINASLVGLGGLPFTYFGFRVASASPSFTFDAPTNFFTSFANLYKLAFATKPAASPADLGPVIGSVGLIPTTKIAANGKATTVDGYYVSAKNAAFGGVLNLIGNRVTLDALRAAGAVKYRILHTAPGAASKTAMASAWTNYRWDGGDYVPEAYAPDGGGRYVLPLGGTEYSIDDLLIQFPSYGMTPGKHRFEVEFYQADGVTVVPAVEQPLELFIDNTLPVVKIDSITHGGAEVTACAIEHIGAAPDGVGFRITAHDPEGNLLAWSFAASYGESQGVAIANQSYDGSVLDWSGVVNHAVPSSPWRPPTSCAYSFVVTALARTTNGYGHIGHSSYHRNVTLTV